MRPEREKILKMVADGQISAAEGERLLRAIEAPAPFLWQRLVNPFDRLPEPLGLLLSLAGAGLGLVLSTSSSLRFDGALDAHQVTQKVPVFQAISDQVVSWGLPAVLFWLASVILARQGRFIDFLVAVGVARIPLILLGGLIVFALPNPNTVMELAFSKPWHPKLWFLTPKAA